MSRAELWTGIGSHTEPHLLSRLVLLLKWISWLGSRLLRRYKHFVQIAQGTAGSRTPTDDMDPPMHHSRSEAGLPGTKCRIIRLILTKRAVSAFTTKDVYHRPPMLKFRYGQWGDPQRGPRGW